MKFEKNTLKNVKWRHIFGLQQTWSYDRYQGSGYGWAILPALVKVANGDKEKLKDLMKNNTQFFNTSAIFSPLITGVHMAMLEDDADDFAQNIKVSMMGPLAGVGDTLAGVVINPLFTLISCQFALAGNWIMAIVLTFAIRFLWIFVQSKLFDLGYNKGAEAIDSTTSNNILNRGIHYISMFGAIILGGFIPKQLSNIKIGWEYIGKVDLENTESTVLKVQDMFDGIMPYMVPLILLAIVYLVLKKYKLSALQMLILIFILAALSYFTGFLVIA